MRWLAGLYYADIERTSAVGYGADLGLGFRRWWRHASGRSLDRWVRPLPLVGAAWHAIDCCLAYSFDQLLQPVDHGNFFR